MNKVLIAYVPVVHRGYMKMFRRYSGSTLLIIGESILRNFPTIVRDIRASAPKDIATMVQALCIFDKVLVLEKEEADEALFEGKYILPDEEISRAFAETYLSRAEYSFERVFLRWHWGNVTKNVSITADREVGADQCVREFFSVALREADKSSDWWRQVGAVVVKEGQMLLVAHNKHAPSEHTPYLIGDPRASFSPPGTRIEISGAHHAEKQIIARAARLGISLEGTDLFVTTFPCPVCAYDVAEVGFRRVYFLEGYSLANALDALRAKRIEIIRVIPSQPLSV